MAAVLVPNVEFIFGLTGSTAAALMSFIFPAWVFLLAATSQRTSARADLALPQCEPGDHWHCDKNCLALLCPQLLQSLLQADTYPSSNLPVC